MVMEPVIREYEREGKVTERIKEWLKILKDEGRKEEDYDEIDLIEKYKDLLPCNNENVYEMIAKQYETSYTKVIRNLLWMAVQKNDVQGILYFLQCADGRWDSFGTVTESEIYTWKKKEKQFKMESDAPPAYIAILTGNIPMVQCFRKQGAYETTDCMREVAAAGKIITSIGTDETGLGYYVHALWNESHWVCSDVLSAAILSGDSEMIDFVVEAFPDIPWNKGLEICLSKCEKRLLKKLLGYYPEIMKYISLDRILNDRNGYLLLEYIKTHGSEREIVIEILDNILNAGWFGLFDDGLNSARTMLCFYRNMMKRFREDREIRRKLKRVIHMELKGPFVSQELVGFLKELQEEEDTYTELLLEMEQSLFNTPLVNISVIDKECLIPIDLYEEYAIDFDFQNIKIMEELYCRILEGTYPIRIEDRTDRITEAIVQSGKISLIKRAIKRGFITPVNVRAILRFGNDIPLEWKVRIPLFRLVSEISLEQQYRI